VHNVADAQKGFAKLAARMEVAEIVGGEAFALQRRYGQRVAKRQHHRRRRGRRKAQRADFRLRRKKKQNVRGLRQRALRAARNADQRNGKAPRIIDKIAEFSRFAGIGQRDDDVFRHDHAEVAMTRLAGMDK